MLNPLPASPVTAARMRKSGAKRICDQSTDRNCPTSSLPTKYRTTAKMPHFAMRIASGRLDA